MRKTVTPEPAIIVIFGITGDLARRKLLPALYHLVKDDLLHPKTLIVGVTRQKVSEKQFLNKVELCVNEVDKVCDPEALRKIGERLKIYTMDVTQAREYDKLYQYLNKTEDDQKMCMNRLYYLSIPPQVFGPIVRFMGERGMNTSCQHGVASTRLLIEKPFGYDLESAKMLIQDTEKHFSEDQIFRIDHYLAKETAQDILQFRYANPIFIPIWNRHNVDSIMIKATEELGIENRVNFYDQTGALRDLIQSHLLQLLALVTMELPSKLQSEQIHKRKQDLFKQIRPVPPNKISKRAKRGQYAGYKKQVGKPKSFTETYAAIDLYIDNPRWKNVPMKLITGKAMSKKRTDITLQFKTDKNGEHNRLTFRIQPDEGIELRLKVKKPGFAQATETALMDFDYEKTFENHGHPDAYERVLIDAIKGDHMLFATAYEVIAGWKIIQPVLDVWSRDDKGLLSYKFGSEGPAEK